MSFNPTVPGYEGENTPAMRFRFAGFVGAAVPHTGNWIPLPRGSWASAPFGPRETALSKNIDNALRCKGDSPFCIWVSEGIGLRVV